MSTMAKYTTLAVTHELKELLGKIGAKRDAPTKWSTVAKDALWGYVAMHRARGAIE